VIKVYMTAMSFSVDLRDEKRPSQGGAYENLPSSVKVSSDEPCSTDSLNSGTTKPTISYNRANTVSRIAGSGSWT
jgi:hypothetical protein